MSFDPPRSLTLSAPRARVRKPCLTRAIAEFCGWWFGENGENR